MLQFYLLSILLNLLCALMLAFDESVIGKVIESKESLLHLVVGGLSVFVALIKIFVPVSSGATVYLFGDLISVAAGFAGGASLLVQYFSEKSEEGLALPAFVDKILSGNQKIVGYVCLGAAILHFILPAVVLF